MQTDHLKHIETLSREESGVISALLYFDIFDHPLSLEEIMQCSRVPLQDARSIINTLCERKLIFSLGTFYSIKNNPVIAQKRTKGNELAAIYLRRARIVSRFISWFPFVRGVIISGSLSKAYMDKESDIDFFIITEKGRLWICRSFLAAWRKLMIGPLKRYFCINYFISTDTLKIPDENLFTATELVFMYPTYGSSVYRQIMAENGWIKQYYPYKELRNNHINDRKYKYSPKSMVETLLKGTLGEKLDTRLFHFMLKRWKKRYKNEFDEAEFDLNIRTKKQVSKQHEKGHQFLILNKYKKQLSNFESIHGIALRDD